VLRRAEVSSAFSAAGHFCLLSTNKSTMPASPEEKPDKHNETGAGDDRLLFIGRQRHRHRGLIEAPCPRLGGSCRNLLEAQCIFQRAGQISVEAVRIGKFACMANGPQGHVVAVTRLRCWTASLRGDQP
jgi:hypothetical protein